eukprot:SAG22_NODE_4323_length_1304_cov_1.204149_1_plen_168_part_10
MIAQFVMAQIDFTQPINEMLMPLYRLSPGFCLGHGLWTLTTSTLLSSYMGTMAYSPLSLDIAGTDCLYMFVLSFVYLGVAFAVEYAQSKPNIAAKFAPASLQAVQDAPYEVDEDVAAEADRVLAKHAQGGGGGGGGGGDPDELIRLVKVSCKTLPFCCASTRIVFKAV